MTNKTALSDEELGNVSGGAVALSFTSLETGDTYQKNTNELYIVIVTQNYPTVSSSTIVKCNQRTYKVDGTYTERAYQITASSLSSGYSWIGNNVR